MHMGFFDELGSIISDFTSMGDELKQTAQEAVDNITESKDELVNLKDEVSTNLEDITGPSEK